MKKFIFSLLFVSFLQADMIQDLKETVCHEVNYLNGWCSQEKARKFFDLVIETRPLVCVEIGVFGGCSVFPVAMALKHLEKGVIIAIDPWSQEEAIRNYDPDKDKAHIHWWSKLSFEQIFNSYLNMISRFQLEDQVITFKTTGEMAAKVIGPIDILYIDRAHTEESAIREVQNYLPKVKSGGYIWVNESLSFNLQPALDLLVDSCELIDIIDNGNCILFRKE